MQNAWLGRCQVCAPGSRQLHGVGFWVSPLSCILSGQQRQARELAHSAQPVLSAAAETSSGKRAELVRVVPHLASAPAPRKRCRPKTRHLLAPRGCALYLQEASLCRVSELRSLCSLPMAFFHALKERSPCIELPAPDRFWGAWTSF